MDLRSARPPPGHDQRPALRAQLRLGWEGRPHALSVCAQRALSHRAAAAGNSSMTFPRTDFASASNAFERESLVTNALGGFACGTVAQANTRRYHGLLVASLQPPVQRVLMVSKVEVHVRYRNRSYELGSNEFAGGTISPRGFEVLSAFEDDEGLPVWTYACADARLEQRVWMADGRNTTYVRFQLRDASAALDLELRPLCTYRDYHSHARGGWSLEVADEPRGCRVTAFSAARPYRVLTDRGDFQREPDWYWNFYHRAEAERGLDATEDLFRPGTFRVRLEPGDVVRSGTQASALTVARNTRGGARLDQATDARCRSVHRAPLGAGRRVARNDRYRRLSVVQRLGARYHDRAAGPGARHREDPGRGRNPAHLCRARERGNVAEPLSGWRRGTRVQHGRRDTVVFPCGGGLPRRHGR